MFDSHPPILASHPAAAPDFMWLMIRLGRGSSQLHFTFYNMMSIMLPTHDMRKEKTEAMMKEKTDVEKWRRKKYRLTVQINPVKKHNNRNQ